MKILAPVNRPDEIEAVVSAGADEVYCGLLPPAWKRDYSNVASMNRREWSAANIEDPEGLKRICGFCRRSGVPVFLAMNALYSQEQYPLVFETIDRARGLGISGVIVADMGLLVSLRERDMDIPVHISTGGTTFNSATARFYKQMGARRIVLPRHLRVDEISDIVRRCPDMEFEVFILNSGCKNIDGFCTFHHGVNEALHPGLWDLFKRQGFDRRILRLLQLISPALSAHVKGSLFGIDSACLLDYKVSLEKGGGTDPALARRLARRISRSFNLITGADTCGVCRLAEFIEAGVYGVKIVGRNYPTSKKVADIVFLKTVAQRISRGAQTPDMFRAFVRDTYARVYKMPCRRLCYYPDGM